MQKIATTRLTLRSFTLDDIDVYHAAIYNDPDVTRYLPGGTVRSKKATKSIIEYYIEHEQTHGYTVWAVLHNQTNNLVGHCGLVHVLDSPEDVELVYAVRQDLWGQGLATEAARASLQYGFETAKLEEILAFAYPPNKASERVMQKLGMYDEGITDLYYDTELTFYSMTRPAFLENDSIAASS